MLKETVRKFGLHELLRKDAICRTDFVLRILCRTQCRDEYSDIVALFLGRLKKEQVTAEAEIRSLGKAVTRKNFKWVQFLKISGNAVESFGEGDWIRALEIFYRKDSGLKRPQDLTSAIKKMCELRK